MSENGFKWDLFCSKELKTPQKVQFYSYKKTKSEKLKKKHLLIGVFSNFNN